MRSRIMISYPDRGKGGVMNRAVAVLIAATILISVGSGATWYLRRPVPQSSYYGVTLSDGKPEVLYKLGVPQHVTGPPELSGVPKGWVPVYDVDGDPTSDKNALPPGKKYSDFDGWEYVSSKTSADRINVDFGKADGKIRNIDCYSGSKNV